MSPSSQNTIIEIGAEISEEGHLFCLSDESELKAILDRIQDLCARGYRALEVCTTDRKLDQADA